MSNRPRHLHDGIFVLKLPQAPALGLLTVRTPQLARDVCTLHDGRRSHAALPALLPRAPRELLEQILKWRGD